LSNKCLGVPKIFSFP